MHALEKEMATHSSLLAWRIPGMGEPGGLPFPSPGDLPDPGIEPRSPALWADSLPFELPGEAGLPNGPGSLRLEL